MLSPWFDVDAAFAEMSALSKQIDALVGNRGLDGRHGLRGLDGQADDLLVDGNDAWSWSIDLPGVRRENVSVSVEGGRLTIKARREPYAPPEGAVLRYAERRPFEYERVYTLPETADTDNISAKFEQGVLGIRVPKRERPKAKQILIQGA